MSTKMLSYYCCNLSFLLYVSGSKVLAKFWLSLFAGRKNSNPCFSTGKTMSDVLIYPSINPQYGIPLLGRFTLIIHHISISRTLVERQLYTDCFEFLGCKFSRYLCINKPMLSAVIQFQNLTFKFEKKSVKMFHQSQICVLLVKWSVWFPTKFDKSDTSNTFQTSCFLWLWL